MNPLEMIIVMVVAAMAIVAVAKALGRGSDADWLRAHNGKHGPYGDGEAPETERLKGEVAQLKERIAVLERLATDDNSARTLDREIEKLR